MASGSAIMFGWIAPHRRILTIYAMLDKTEGVVYAEEFKVPTFKLRLQNVVTKSGAEFAGGDNYWSGLPAPALAQMLGMAAKVQGAIQKAANQGGPITVALTCAVTSDDGGTPPPGSNASQSFDGITLHGLSDIEDAMHKVGDDLKKLGRDNADKKEGKKK